MKYLVDVNVLSEVTKPVPEPKVVEWLRTREPKLVLDPVVLGEIRLGILLLPAGKRRALLEAWFDARVGTMVCIPWDASTALEWAALLGRLRTAGETMPLKDSMVAATALTHGFTIATRNVRDFAKAGVKLVDPFE
jgi:predicted nucleic acid-binding protein